MFCHKCGTQIAESAGFCHKCGARVVRDNTAHQTYTRASPNPGAAPRMQANFDNRQRSVLGLCKVVFALRLIDAIGWTLVIILQIIAGYGFGQIMRNIIATGFMYVNVKWLFNVISSNVFSPISIMSVAAENMGLAILGIIFYGWQLYFDGIPTMLLFIVLEFVILVMGAITYLVAREVKIETTPYKDMTVRLQKDEIVILEHKCTHYLSERKLISYGGIGTLTNNRFIFTSYAENTYEWVVATYGDYVPFHLITDVTIWLADITSVRNVKTANHNEISIQTKEGMSYVFRCSVPLKDLWQRPNVWYDAFLNAIAVVKAKAK